MGELFSYFEGDLEIFLNYVKALKDNHLVKIKLASASEIGGLEIDGTFNHVLDNFAVKHITSKHSNKKEELRGQIVIQRSDFLLIPEIITSFDSCIIQSQRTDKTTITYSKSYPIGEYIYIEEIRKGRRELAGVTLYIRKKETHRR